MTTETTIKDLHFETYEELVSACPDTPRSKRELVEIIRRMQDEDSNEECILSAEEMKLFSREEIEGIERRKIIPIEYSPEKPFGAYALDNFVCDSSLFPEGDREEIPLAEGKLILLRNAFRKRVSLVTKSSVVLTKEEIETAPFENVPTTTQVLAVCSRNEEGEMQWGSSHLYPAGDHVQPALTTGEQYGQVCFEGLVAMVNEKGEICVFRHEKNAQRLQKSCEKIGLVPLKDQQIIESIKYAILSNKDYLPASGSDAKMYVRPYVKGVAGGCGINSAETHVFGIEVFPYGNYLGGKDATVSLLGQEEDRRAGPGGSGSDKVGGNYAPTLPLKKKAKEKGYDDIFFFGLEDNQELLEEASAANIFFIGQEEGEIVLYTPPLDRETILPGITRESVIQIAEKIGIKVREKELSFDDIKNMKGAFLSGSAAGMVRIGSMTYKGELKEFDQEKESSSTANNITNTFFKIYDLLYQARKGVLDPEMFPEFKDWVTVLGTVEQE